MKKAKTPGCLECGDTLVQLPKKRAKKFCNSTCRSSYFQKTQRRLAKEKLAEVTKVAEKARKKKDTGGLPLPKDFKKINKLSTVDKNGKVVIKDVAKAAKKKLSGKLVTIEEVRAAGENAAPKTLKELKELCPYKSGLERSSWISQKRLEYKI